MSEVTKRFECYLNIQKSNGVGGNATIISGTGESVEEAQALFDHAMKTYLENKEK